MDAVEGVGDAFGDPVHCGREGDRQSVHEVAGEVGVCRKMNSYPLYMHQN